jgi:hypothetical protein
MPGRRSIFPLCYLRHSCMADCRSRRARRASIVLEPASGGDSRVPSGHCRSGRVSGSMKPHVFISYTGVDRNWATWIAWCLEEAGHRVTIQAWDFRPGQNFVVLMDEALKACDRVVAVLSPDFQSSPFATAEWSAAFARDPRGQARILIPVRVKDFEPKGLLSQVIYVDVVRLSENAASRKISDALQDGRAKPDRKPSFPGLPRSRSQHPPYPGAWSSGASHPGRGARRDRLQPTGKADFANSQTRRKPSTGKSYAVIGVALVVLGVAALVLWQRSPVAPNQAAAIATDRSPKDSPNTPSPMPVPPKSSPASAAQAPSTPAAGTPYGQEPPSTKLAPNVAKKTRGQRPASIRHHCGTEQIGRASGVAPFPRTVLLNPCSLDAPARRILEREVIPLARRTQACGDSRSSEVIHIGILAENGIVRFSAEDTMFARDSDAPQSCIDRIWADLIGLRIPTRKSVLNIGLVIGDD